MNKTAQTEWERLFLIETLPEPLNPASQHLQLFDNYIEGTRMRIRGLRDPYSNAWTHSLQQRFTIPDASGVITKMAEIHLNEAEHAVFERFEGREIRKNRYFHEFDRRPFVFDVYLGQLWGLNMAKAEFDSRDAMEVFLPPPFAIFEATGDAFFSGHSLVTKTFADVQAEVAKLIPAIPVIPDE